MATAISTNRASLLWLGCKDALKNGLGWCLEKCEAPAKVRAFEYVDPESNETVYLYTSKRYSVLCVGDRRFYFDRISGKFDGISAPANCISGWLKFGD